MRILFLTHLYLPTLGGVQRSVRNLTVALAARGHEVSIATHRPGGLFASAAVHEGIPVLGLDIPTPFSFGPRAAAKRVLLDAVNAIAIRRWCTRRRIQLVHCHLINVDTRYAAVGARATGARTIVTLRGGETEHWLAAHPRRRSYVARVLREADYVTAVAGALLRQACALVPAVGEKSQVVPNPVVPEALAASAAPHGAVPLRPYVLFAGRLEAMKGVATLIDAFHRACADPRFQPALLIAGEGALQPSLEAQARSGAGRSRIFFLGRRDFAATLALIREAEALVLPSRSSEGCPNVALEAMALGTPLLVSDLEALRELVADGECGAVFSAGDPRALADELQTLARDPARRARYVAAARVRLAARHGLEAVLDEYERIYERLLM